MASDVHPAARSGARTLLSAIALGALFFATASVSMANFGVNTPIWFCNAFAIAWLLQDPGRRRWPLLIGAVWVAEVLAIWLFGSGPAPILAVADTIEIVVAAILIQRIGGAAAALSSVSGMVRLIAICVGVPVLSAAWGAGFLTLFDGTAFVPAFAQWYGATSLGLLIVCPALLIWLTPELRPRLAPQELRWTLILAAALAAIGVLIFNLHSAAALFVVFPALLLLVWRSGLAGASIGSIVLAVVGLSQIFVGAPAIHILAHPATDATSQVQALQVYLAALALSSLPLAVVLGDQQRLSAELARVAEARSHFLAAMSHEIRTPMTAILGIVDLLESESTTPAQRQYLGSIRSSGRHLLNIINDILDFSRIETGHIELEQIEFSLPVLLGQLAAILDPLARERRIDLNFELAQGSPPVVKGDPTRLKQVLINLAGNAIKFTPSGTVEVLVTYRAEGVGSHGFRFEVRDTGIGIPADKQDELFAAFTQADRSTRRRFGGSGLGLAISKMLVTAMGGEIGVASVEGEGSLFWFEVPLEEGQAERLPDRSAAGAADVAPQRVLLVEDVELNRDIIRTVLERKGHRVTLAENGQEAVDLARGSEFDLILMDVHMPVLDGLEATRTIRSFGTPAADVPIVALTANVMASEQAKCLNAGMNAVVMKPIEWDRMWALMREFADHAAAGDAHATAGNDARPPAFDEAAFDVLAGMLPGPLLRAHVGALTNDVRRLTDSTDEPAAQVAELAHKLVSEAGMLGLTRLSALAAEVERAAAAGDSFDQPLAAFAAAAGDIRLLAEKLSAPPAEQVRRTS